MMKALQLTTFSELGLAAPLLKALTEEGYETPTPIQAQAIPALLKGADLLGIAQTGTGKTAAFALPLLSRIAADGKHAPRRSARVLVLSPTRELAAQIGESFRTYGRHLGIRVAVVFGGVSHKPQIDALSKGVEVLVATPGRLLDHLDSRMMTLDAVEALVLDEADQMLDLGFVRPIRRIVSKMPARRQNLFFSATMPHEIAALAAELLHDPVRVQVTPVATTAERVSQRVIHIEANKKRPLLVELLAAPEMSRTLVFTRTKRGADRVARHLEEAGISAAAIHGNKSQRQREVALDAFRNAKIGVLVATDIAARGIDIDGVTHVVNYELPEVAEAYVHRIGRTARAGAEGDAISLCDGEERDLLRAIERLTRQQIPAEDRRNDPSIVAVPGRPAETERRGERGERGERSGERGERRGGRPGRDRADRNARSDRAPRADRNARPDRGERSEARGRTDGRTDGARPPREAAGAGDRERAPAAHGKARKGHDAGRDAQQPARRSSDSRPHRAHGAPDRDRRPSEGRDAGRDAQQPARRSADSRPHRAHGASDRDRRPAEGRDRGGPFDAHRNSERGGRPERSQRHERSDRHERSERPERSERSERPGRADGAAVAHVFDNGFARGRGDRNRNGGERRNAHSHEGTERPRQGRDGDRRPGKPSHGGKPHRGQGGKPHRGSAGGGGGRGHRGAQAGKRLVDA